MTRTKEADSIYYAIKNTLDEYAWESIVGGEVKDAIERTIYAKFPEREDILEAIKQGTKEAILQMNQYREII